MQRFKFWISNGGVIVYLVQLSGSDFFFREWVFGTRRKCGGLKNGLWLLLKLLYGSV